MKLTTLFLLATGLYLCLSLSLAQGNFEDCCLMYVKELSRKIKRHAVEYRFQVPDGDCNLPAVIFTMRRGREFCADPGARWVIELIKRINEKPRGLNGSLKHHSIQRKG